MEVAMNRRNFMQLGFAGIGSTIVAPGLVIASPSAQSMAGGVYYTADASGRWSKKVQSHFPNVEVEKGPDGAIVRVETRHTFDGYDHYIIKHIALDKDFNFITEHMFNPLQDKAAISKLSLGKYSGPVYALSVCNKHDTWMNVVEV
jgi:superoxide reductase